MILHSLQSRIYDSTMDEIISGKGNCIDIHAGGGGVGGGGGGGGDV